MQLKFIDVRNSKPVHLTFMSNGTTMQVTVVADSMELCGDLA